jgi:hypothetical protein
MPICIQPGCAAFANSSRLCPVHQRVRLRKEGTVKTPSVTRCGRCGENGQCQTWEGSINVCLSCLRLIVLEWEHRRREFGELREAQQ